MSPSAEKKLPMRQTLRTRGRQGAPALADVQDRGRQQQRQHEQALHDVGDACRTRRWREGSREPVRRPPKMNDDEDRDEHALAGDECGEQAGEPDAGTEVGDELVVAEVAAGQHDAAGEAGEAAGDEHRAEAVAPFGDAGAHAPCRGCGRACAAGTRPPCGRATSDTMIGQRDGEQTRRSGTRCRTT